MGMRLIVSGTALSEPGTMGGNSKIALEIVRCLAVRGGVELHLIVPERKVATVTGAIGSPAGLAIHEIVSFPGNELRAVGASVRHYTAEIRRVLADLGAGPDDLFYSASDFHVDTLPAYRLRREFGFRWIAVQFLFVPFIVENLVRGYRFPALKYLLVWFYSKALFLLARRRAEAFVITNDSDRRHFPKSWQSRVFAFYGGVNVDQIPEGTVPKAREVVFCSRLHPQKGIGGFLDTWRLVLERIPSARLTVIGNGAPGYEKMLRDKARRLGVAGSIDWLGYVNNGAKYEIYRSARVMVHPTVFDNNGMVAAEALCSGLPVVMYDLPALRDVYATGCAKVPYGDRRAFADEICRLLSDPSRYAAVAPTPEQVAALRTRWDWPNRVAGFWNWANAIKSRR